MKKMMGLLVGLTIACGGDDNGTPDPTGACPEVGGNAAFETPDNVAIDATYYGTSTAREFSVRLLAPDEFVRAKTDYTIEAFDEETGAAIALTEVASQALQCAPVYSATEDLPDSIVVKLTHTGGFVREELVRVRPVEITSTPETASIDDVFQINLSRNVPVISEVDFKESWVVELRGDCVVDESADRSGFAYMRDPEGVGIEQGTAPAGVLNVLIAAASISGGCEVEATLVSNITGLATLPDRDRNYGEWRSAPTTFTVQ